MSTSSKGSHIAKGTAWIFMAESLLLPTGLLITIYLTRRLGPENYGLFALAASLIAWVETIGTSFFDRATIKFVGQTDDWQNVATRAVHLHLLVGVAGLILIWLLAKPISMALNEPALAFYLYLFALDLPLYTLARAHQNVQVGLGNFKQRAIATSGRWLSRVILILLLVQLGFSITGAIAGSLFASLIELVICRYLQPIAIFSWPNFPTKKLMGYAAPLFIFSAGMMLFSMLGLFALKAMGGTTADVGIYGAAQTLARIPNLFTKSFAPVLLAGLSSALYVKHTTQAKTITQNAMRLFVLGLPFVALVAGSAHEIIPLVFGPEYALAAPLLGLLIFAALVQGFIRISASVLTAANNPGWPSKLAVAMLSLVAIGHLVLIPRLGSVGAAGGTAVVAALGALASVWVIYRMWRILPPLGTCLRSLLLFGLVFVLAFMWSSPGLWVISKLIVGSAFILGALLLLGEFNTKEIATVSIFFRQFFSTAKNPIVPIKPSGK